MDNKFLDNEGLLHLWIQLKQMFGGKVDREDGKGLSENDFTDQYKAKLDAIGEGANNYSHPLYNSFTGKPEVNQTPGFGGNFSVSQVVTDGLGHVTELNERTVKIPDSEMSPAGQSMDGARGLVPAPKAGEQNKFLRGDGSWADVSTEDRRVGMVLEQNKKAYLLASTEAPTNTSQTVTAVADTGVYLDETAGVLHATSFSGNGENVTSLKAENITSGTINANRLPLATDTSPGAMSAADKTKLSGFESSENYAKKSDITNMYKFKGSVQKEEDLPSSGNVAGDVYNVIATNMNYAWTGTEWDSLGEIFKITAITNNEIDAILAT